jgi:hypothetical protein
MLKIVTLEATILKLRRHSIVGLPSTFEIMISVDVHIAFSGHHTRCNFLINFKLDVSCKERRTFFIN